MNVLFPRDTSPQNKSNALSDLLSPIAEDVGILIQEPSEDVELCVEEPTQIDDLQSESKIVDIIIKEPDSQEEGLRIPHQLCEHHLRVFSNCLCPRLYNAYPRPRWCTMFAVSLTSTAEQKSQNTIFDPEHGPSATSVWLDRYCWMRTLVHLLSGIFYHAALDPCFTCNIDIIHLYQ